MLCDKVAPLIMLAVAFDYLDHLAGFVVILDQDLSAIHAVILSLDAEKSLKEEEVSSLAVAHDPDRFVDINIWSFFQTTLLGNNQLLPRLVHARLLKGVNIQHVDLAFSDDHGGDRRHQIALEIWCKIQLIFPEIHQDRAY